MQHGHVARTTSKEARETSPALLACVTSQSNCATSRLFSDGIRRPLPRWRPRGGDPAERRARVYPWPILQRDIHEDTIQVGRI
jgi:hypothetical protein